MAGDKDTTKAASGSDSASAAAKKPDTVTVQYEPKNLGQKLAIEDDETGFEWRYGGKEALPTVTMPRAVWEANEQRLNMQYQKRENGLFAGRFTVVEG